MCLKIMMSIVIHSIYARTHTFTVSIKFYGCVRTLTHTHRAKWISTKLRRNLFANLCEQFLARSHATLRYSIPLESLRAPKWDKTMLFMLLCGVANSMNYSFQVKQRRTCATQLSSFKIGFSGIFFSDTISFEKGPNERRIKCFTVAPED